MVFNRTVKINLNNKGQTTVEYVLLMAVVALMIFTVFKSPFFQQYFGADGTFVNVYKNRLEYGYKHPVPGTKDVKRSLYRNNNHDSYKAPSGGTRFFGALETYPE